MITVLMTKDPSEQEMNALARHLLNLSMSLVHFFFNVPRGPFKEAVNYQTLSSKDLAKSVASEGG